MPVHLLGIRHHGPGSARAVRTALDEQRPSAVLVELPADAQSALSWIGRPGLEPPVAVLGYLKSDPSRAAFAPLARFSPEWQAALWANQRGIELIAIDAPLGWTLGAQVGAEIRAETVAGTARDDPPPDPLRELAAAAGDLDPERWWEDVIEHRGDGSPAFAAVAEAMRAARGDWQPGRREARREAHMRRAIRAARRAGHDTIAVICGAWHVPALDVDATTASADAAIVRGARKASTAVAWVPWTSARLAVDGGYGAGVDSPGWYRHVFDHPGPDGVGRFVVELAHTLRDDGLAASPDEVIAGTRLADALAALRDRPRAGLGEVIDATGAVFGRVDRLEPVRRRLIVGDDLGTVPADAPQAPLARDVERARKSARLRLTAGARTLEVDLRTPAGRRKSVLLHRLLALGVPWGVVEEGRGTAGTFRETWRLSWEPELAVRLVERSSYGTTVESAATGYLVERCGRATSLIEVVGLLDRALLAELPDAIDPLLRTVAARAARDPDVGELIDAAPPLAAAIRYGDVRGTDEPSLRRVFDELVARALVALPDACASLDDSAAQAMVERLTELQGALATLEHPARFEDYPGVLGELSERAANGLVQGRATRLLHDSGAWSADMVQRRLGRALTPGTPATRGAAFVEGFLAGAGTVLLHDGELRALIDQWIASLPADGFESVVALLRRTFGAFESAERRRLMALLFERDHEAEPLGGIDAERAEAVLVTVRRLLGVPT